MQLKRTATAVWNGNGLEGKGHLSTRSTALAQLPYSFHGRFVDEAGTAGTNPEELIAAAHAGCYSMALSFQLSGAGFTVESLETEAVLTVEKEDTGWTIKAVTLHLKGRVPGITGEQFHELALAAKAGCPVSRVLNAEISLVATLEA